MAMVDNETVVHEGCSRYGLHTVRVLRPGNPVDRERWIQSALDAGADPDRLVHLEWQEEELGIHYLQVWWRNHGTEGFSGWIG
jgi:hypothetical protein